MADENESNLFESRKSTAFNLDDAVTNSTKVLSEAEQRLLQEQNKRMVSDFQSRKLELEARKHWDLFYKRNETRFFKDRHWTTREFEELLCDGTTSGSGATAELKRLLEIGCGVGNLVFPLLEEGIGHYFIYACDLSPRAVELVKQHNLYNEQHIKAFPCDITTDDVFQTVEPGSLDLITSIFVLSAIHPGKFATVARNLFRLLKPGGMVLFRDYGLYDMAQLRFKAGNKIGENFYMRQDGTRSYFFADAEVERLFRDAGFETVVNNYIHRRTVNPKEGIDVPRIFVQSKFRKPDG
ncbi:tRNA N(3)-methylcytidine methyltransferase METTL6 [Uranotaenia lowii]|uniref:tRNA N(3)-methylcytidine methyltransferase METTL6 n=1 Tax=Uranotaenia lowii TaxID=190385 RepID=UPI00247A2D8C|nr:tRNA N(3)-methylcytidine methyltransferase METTL6 [Uranotaenia lowii]